MNISSASISLLFDKVLMKKQKITGGKKNISKFLIFHLACFLTYNNNT